MTTPNVMTRSVIQIRVTPEQRDQLERDRGNTPLSEYVRAKLGLGRRGTTTTQPVTPPVHPAAEQSARTIPEPPEPWRPGNPAYEAAVAEQMAAGKSRLVAEIAVGAMPRLNA